MNEVLQWIVLTILILLAIPTVVRFVQDFMEDEEDE